jgi:hypothetical protein
MILKAFVYFSESNLTNPQIVAFTVALALWLQVSEGHAGLFFDRQLHFAAVSAASAVQPLWCACSVPRTAHSDGRSIAGILTLRVFVVA